jgi:hypothetical protein
MNQNLFNVLSANDFIALQSELEEVKDAVFKDLEENAGGISDKDYMRLRSIVRIYEGEKQFKEMQSLPRVSLIYWLKMVIEEKQHYPIFKDKELNENALYTLWEMGKSPIDALNDLSTIN